MSAPVTNKQNSWVSSEDAQGRGQYNYYNPNHATPVNNDWHQGYNPMHPQVNQGATDWGYQQQHQHQQQQQHSQGYGHQYQQPNTQLAQQYPVYQGPSNVTPTSNASDPWNWGWDESGNVETANNNAKPDPTWDWSVEGSTAYQEPVGSSHYMRQHQEPIGTSSNYVHRHQEPVGANSYVQHHQERTWNAPTTHTFGSDSARQNNMSGYTTTNRPLHHFGNAPQAPNTQMVIEDAFNTASVVNQNTFEHQQNIFQTVGKTHQNLTSFSGGNDVHLLNNNQAEDHSFIDHSLQNNETTDVNSAHTQLLASDSQPETSVRTNNVMLHRPESRDQEQESSSDKKAEPLTGAAAGDSVAEVVPIVAVERKYGTNEVLASQWSTESLPSQGSDEVSQTTEGGRRSDITSPAPTVSQSPLDTEGSSLSDSQFNQGYQYNFKQEQTVGDMLQHMPQAENPSTGPWKQDLQQSSIPEVLSICGVESKSIIVPYPLQTMSQSCEEASVEGTTMLSLTQSGYTYNEMYMELNVTQSEYLPTSGASSLHSVDNVSSDLKSLTLGSNANSSSADVENVEIVPPEHNHPGGMFPRSGHVSSDTTPPPPMVVATPTTGPPKVTGNSTGMNSNPYASGKTALSHKYSGNKLRSLVQSNNGDGSVDSNSTVPNLTQPDPNPGANLTSVSQFGSSEMMPLYNSSVMGDASGGFSSRAKMNLMSTAEDVVNLETVPDNKERPDFMDLQQPVVQLERKVARMNVGPVGQDAIQGSQGLWSQQSEHSASPENLEVAPRCGPDRNQYLETGQLTEAPGRMPDVLDSLQCRPPPGLRRMVPGQMTEQSGALQVASTTPPPGLHRMIPGQLTESESGPTQDGGAGGSHQNNSGDDVLLHRMVPGRLTVDEPTGGSVPDDGIDGMVPVGNSVDEIPPPGLRRMVPGESSSPESQAVGGAMLAQGESFQPIDSVPMEPRVVTGVARDEVDGGSGQMTGLQLAPSPMQLSANSRVASEPESPSSETNMASNNLPQPTSERSETIGSDSVETYPPPPADNSPRDLSNRRDTSNKERERRHRDDQDMEERTGSGSHRRRDYYGPRERDREQDESPGSGNRYPDDRERRPYDRELEESSGSGRYRDERDRRRYDSRQDYGRRAHEEEQRSRHRRAPFDCVDPEVDAEDYFSDRDRDRPRDRDLDRDRDRREKPVYEYDQRYRERVPEKGGRDRQDHRTSGRDRDRERDRERYDRRRHDYPQEFRRGDDYYGRGYEDDPYYRDQRSRPPSRSGSRPEYDDGRRRDYHNYEGYNYYGRTAIDLYHYQYYMAAWQRYLQQGSGCPDDRGSVHSGRSSANEERAVEQSNSLLEEGVTTTPQRLTPAKFSTAHIKGIQTSRGQLLKVLPHYPLDGQSATVEIHDIQNLIAYDNARRELLDFPGPLVKGVTHKKSLMAFCMRKIKTAERDSSLMDRESVVLLWRLLVLLLRQNGTVVGTDISELLLSSSSGHESTGSISSPSPAISQHSVSDAREAPIEEHQPSVPTKTEEEVTNNFREFLLYGNTKEALEWAMKHGLWGHALFLASKMDQRTYANVMMRFANGLTLNDPLQTLYQLMSGRLPAAVTCCADEKWGDWKPHLAMVLSNSSSRPDLDHRAITTLGDTLAARGCLHAAHFCYLMAQLEFGTYNVKASKMVLLGSSHAKPFMEFACNDAIQMTEIYVYTCQLADPVFELPQFQNYKLLYAMRLAEEGFPTEALQYVEVITRTVLRRPATYNLEFVQQLYELGNKLKYHDPVYSAGDQDEPEKELPWLVQCRNVINDYLCGVLQPDGPSYGSTSNLSYSEGDPVQSQPPTVDQPLHTRDAQQYDGSWQQQQPVYYPDQDTQQWLPQQIPAENQAMEGYPSQPDPGMDASQQVGADQANYWTPQQWGGGQDGSQPASSEPEEYRRHQSVESSRPGGAFNYWDVSANHQEGSPQVTLAGSIPVETTEQSAAQAASESKPLAKSKPKKDQSKSMARSSWFGGIWNKLALRPKNQMILPDDKNPSIVWDPDKKRWTNVDGEEDESVANLPPPPKALDLAGNNNMLPPAHSSGNGAENRPPVPPSGQNIYKMSRGRSLRANYVDVLGGSKASQPVVPAPDLFPAMSALHIATHNFFIPAPVESNDGAPMEFLTPAVATSEVQEPTSGESSQGGVTSDGAPMMFNPSSFPQPAAATKYTGTLNRKRYQN